LGRLEVASGFRGRAGSRLSQEGEVTSSRARMSGARRDATADCCRGVRTVLGRSGAERMRGGGGWGRRGKKGIWGEQDFTLYLVAVVCMISF